MKVLQHIVSVMCIASIFLCAILLYEASSGTQRSQLWDEISDLKADIIELQERVSDMAPELTKRNLPDDMLWKSSSRVEAELALQSSLMAVSENLGIRLLGFGSSGMTKEVNQETIAFEFETEGPLREITTLLAELEKVKPKIAVGALRIRPSQHSSSTPHSDTHVYSQTTVWAFWAGSQ